jgi:hypothetical protein
LEDIKVEFIFGLFLIIGIFKLLGWVFSPMLDKIGDVVYLVRANEFEEARKKDEQRIIDAMQAKLMAQELENAFLRENQLNKSQENNKTHRDNENYFETTKVDFLKVIKDVEKPQSDEQFQEIKAKEEPIKPTEIDPLKAKGDKYERYIGKRFEEKGDLVIYNGLIRDYADGGVDIASISTDAKTINLVQCKHWSLKVLEMDHIKKIYEKLNTHNLDFLRLGADQIVEHLSAQKQNHEIEELLTTARKNKKNLQIRKTLYISSDKVVDLEIGKHLTMMQANIFRYQDMKIVVEVYH